jgi:hypothetical protein
MSAHPAVAELAIADVASAWAAAGFAVEEDRAVVGSVRLRLEGPGRGRGIVGVALSGLDSLDLDGLPATPSDAPPPEPGPAHPNGVQLIDHLVAFTPDLDRTSAALQAAGLDLRRVREQPTPGGAPRQGFFRLGELILEVVQAPDGSRIAADPDGPAQLWGISFVVADLDATAAALGESLGTPRDAVQPGRRIATLRREAGLGPAIAFMTPRG